MRPRVTETTRATTEDEEGQQNMGECSKATEIRQDEEGKN